MTHDFSKGDRVYETVGGLPHQQGLSEKSRHASAELDNSNPSNDDPFAVTSEQEKQDLHELSNVLDVLEQMDVLRNRKLCMNLVAHITERVGYQCAGYTTAITVAELMLMSARATELAEHLDQVDIS